MDETLRRSGEFLLVTIQRTSEEIRAGRELSALTVLIPVSKGERVDESRAVEMRTSTDDCQCLSLGAIRPDEIATFDNDQPVEHGRSVPYSGSTLTTAAMSSSGLAHSV